MTNFISTLIETLGFSTNFTPVKNIQVLDGSQELEQHPVTWNVMKHHPDVIDLIQGRTWSFTEFQNILRFVAPMCDTMDIRYLGKYELPELIAEVCFRTEDSEVYDSTYDMEMSYNADVEWISRAPQYRQQVYKDLHEFASVIDSPDTWGVLLRDSRIAIVRDDNFDYHLVEVNQIGCPVRWDWIMWPKAH